MSVDGTRVLLRDRAALERYVGA